MSIELDLADIQGNIIRAYGKHRFWKARYVFLRIDDDDKGRDFVGEITKLVTTSVTWGKAPEQLEMPRATTNIGFTYDGLVALGLPTASLRSFPPEFIMGMQTRKDILGDDGRSAPDKWDPIWRKEQIHVWISINGQEIEDVEDRYKTIRSLVRKSDKGVVVLSGHCGPDNKKNLAYQDASVIEGKKGKEHFGFADGISDPVFEGQQLPPWRVKGRGKLMQDGSWEPLATGEFILGHPDEAHEYPQAPVPHLLARNGTFMVYRKLHENVGSFNKLLDDQSKNFSGSRELLAAKISGRWRNNGAPVVNAPDDASKKEWDKRFKAASPEEKDAMLSNFTFNDDIDGTKCPLSAHVRRINPRGSLQFGETGAFQRPGALVDRRRMIRRGLPYGEVTDEASDDGNHGIIFMAINADIERQFEFVQQQWINYANDFKEGNDKEVLIGNHNDQSPSKVVLPVPKDSDSPPYFVTNIPRLVETRGGEYFFIPSITALKLIAKGIVDPT